jgi:hypothetical protein
VETKLVLQQLVLKVNTQLMEIIHAEIVQLETSAHHMLQMKFHVQMVHIQTPQMLLLVKCALRGMNVY